MILHLLQQRMLDEGIGEEEDDDVAGYSGEDVDDGDYDDDEEDQGAQWDAPDNLDSEGDQA